MIFDETEILKLGTIDNSKSCVHTNNTDYIYIYINSLDSLLKKANSDPNNVLILKNSDYFVDFNISLQEELVTFTATSIGSTRNITFSKEPLLPVNDGNSCDDYLEQDSITLLGKSPECNFNGKILSIKYGEITGPETSSLIYLNMVNMCIIGVFDRQLPIFTINDTQATNTYQTHQANISLENIQTYDQEMIYSWEYLGETYGETIQPNVTQFVFN